MDEYRDELDREYWEQYDFEHSDHSMGGRKSIIPIIIYVILVFVAATMDGALPVAVFGLFPLFVYYRCM